jgi:hypothetical protein
MRYLLEGLNARGDDAFDSPIYAFVAGNVEDAEEEWHDRGVTPICYNAANGHAALWDTLATWAQAADDAAWWNDRVIALAQKFPSDLAPFERGQVAQLISTKQGAKLFAEATPKPPAEWMCVFDNLVRYGKPRSRSWEDAEEIDPLDIFGLDDDPQRPVAQANGQTETVGVNYLSWRQGDASFPERVGLLGGTEQWTNPLSERLFHLARWFASVAEQPAAVWWAAGYRRLNPNLLWHVGRAFGDRDASYPAVAAHFWRLYIEFNGRTLPDSMDFGWYEFGSVVKKDGWSDSTFRAFERLVEPLVEFSRYSYGAPCPPRENWDKLHYGQVFEAKVRVLDRHGENLDIPDDRLERAVEIVRRSLIRCSALLSETGTLWWRTPTLHPTGQRGEQIDGRKSLHFLWFKALFQRLAEKDPVSGKIEISRWPLEDPYFFGKLAIYAAMLPALASGKEAEATLLGLNDEIFWTRENQRELLFTLKARWTDFSAREKQRLERRIVAGPPKKWDDEKASQYRRRRAADAASRLRWLELNSCLLSPATAKRLHALKERASPWNDNWALSADDSLGSKGGVVERVTELRGLDQLPINEIIPAALERTEDRLGELRDFRPFEGLVAAFPFRALSALRLSLKRGEFHLRFWQNLLSEWPQETSLRLRWLLAETISRLSSNQALELRYYIPRWLKSQLEALAKDHRARALRVFDAIAAPYLIANIEALRSAVGHTTIGGVVQEKSEVSLDKAINAPVGILAQCLWGLLPNKASNRRPMPKYVGNRLQRLFDVPGDGGGHAVCIVARSMGWLDYCYRDWMHRVMLPIFALAHPQSEAAWHGLATDHNGLKPDTLRMLNRDFLNLLMGRAPWSLNDNEFRNHVRRLIFLSHPRDNGGAVIKFAEARTVLMHLDDEKRGDAIWALADVLEGSKNGEEWKIFVEPFIENAWPRQIRFRTEKASRGFARVIECSGEHFPKAVKLLLDLDLLRAVSDLDMITYRLTKTPKDEHGNFATRFPKDTLALLDALIADDRAQRPYELGKVLEVIAEAEPILRQTKAWRRLQDLTI